MAVRTTTSAVIDVMDTILVASDITPFLTAATLIIDEVSTRASYSADLLEQLEIFYTAHLAAACKDPTIQSEKTGDTQAKYLIESGKGLDSTSYGQMVQLLDTEGVLATMGKKAATFESLDIV